ncbi:hypothetical protein BTM255_02110 [Helicobacter pylori]
MSSIKDIIQVYNSVVKDIDKDAQGQDSRAYGEVIRSAKGKLLERYQRKDCKNSVEKYWC